MNKGLLILIGAVVVLVIGAIILLLVGGRGGQQRAAADNTITIWSPFDDRAAFEAMSAKFFEENPGLTLEHRRIEARDAKEYEAKVVNAIANGTGPDLWMVRSDWIPKHAAKSVPIATPANERLWQRLTANFGDRILKLNSFNNQLYGLPIYADTLALAYNDDALTKIRKILPQEQREILRGPIRTWQDFISKTQIIQGVNKQTNINASPIGTVRSTNASVDLFSAFLLQHGGRLADERGDIVFNLPIIADGQTFLPATTALTQYTDFAKSDSPGNIWLENDKDPIEEFVAGRIAILPLYYNQLTAIKARKPGFEIEIGPLPQQSTEGQRVDFGITWSLLISESGSKRLSLFFTQNPSVEIGRYSSIRNTIVPRITDARVPNRPRRADGARDVFRSQLSSVNQLIKPEWQQVDEIIQDMIRLVIENNQLPQTSVDASIDRLKTIVR